MNPITVILADDHQIVRNGIKALLENEGGIQVIDEASNGKEALEKCRQSQPDVLIVDIRMPEMNGIETVKNLPNFSASTKALVLSMHDDEEYIIQSIEVGAAGYLLKDSSKEEFIKAIDTVSEGEKYFSGDISSILVNNYLTIKNRPVQSQLIADDEQYHLTKREKEILHLLYEGVNNKEIAKQLGKSIRTIETHRFNIMKKLGVNSALELMKKIEREPALKNEIQSLLLLLVSTLLLAI